MLEMKVEYIIPQLVEALLLSIPMKERDPKKALYFSLDCGLSFFTDDAHYAARSGLHMVYWAMTNYVTVFSGHTDSCFGHIKEVKEWTHESSHDSCWKTISTFSNLYFKQAKMINAQREEEGLKSIAPMLMNQNVYFNHRHEATPWTWVDVEITKDPKDNWGHKKLLKIL